MGGEEGIEAMSKGFLQDIHQALHGSKKEKADGSPKQAKIFHFTNMDLLYKRAGVAKRTFDQELQIACEQMHRECGIRAVFLAADLKDRMRAHIKCEIKYGCDISQLVDLTRGCLVFETLDSLYRGLLYLIRSPQFSQISQRFVAFEDRFLKPLPGLTAMTNCCCRSMAMCANSKRR